VDVALEAVDVLRTVMHDLEVNASVRVRAAEAILARAGLERPPESSAEDNISVLLGRLEEAHSMKPIEAHYWESE
jgi:hypothetical protein